MLIFKFFITCQNLVKCDMLRSSVNVNSMVELTLYEILYDSLDKSVPKLSAQKTKYPC